MLISRPPDVNHFVTDSFQSVFDENGHIIIPKTQTIKMVWRRRDFILSFLPKENKLLKFHDIISIQFFPYVFKRYIRIFLEYIGV